MTIAIVQAVKVTPTVEVVEVCTTDHHSRSVTQFEVRCSQCPHVEIWGARDLAVLAAGFHTCKSDVVARLRKVWDAAALPFMSRPGDAAAAMFADVVAILGEHGIEPDATQTRMLRWVCGWEPEPVAALVELMVVGRDDMRAQRDRLGVALRDVLCGERDGSHLLPADIEDSLGPLVWAWEREVQS